MKLLPSRCCRRRHRDGFTLVEMMFAWSIGLLIAGGGVLLVLEAAKENARSVADMSLEQAASDLESRVVECLRTMSAREAVVYTSPAEDGGETYRAYRSVIVARGPAPDFPRSELRFEPDSGRVVFLSNRLVTASQKVLMQNQTNRFVVRNLCFFPAIKSDTTPDNSLINVVIELDDDGASARRTASNFARIQRTLSVKMRNN